MRTLAFILPTLLGIAFLSACDEATLGPEFLGTIEGRVLTSETLDPIAGANVVTSPPTSALITDSEGKFSLAEIQAGNYTVTAKKPGYASNSVSVSVSDMRTTSATITLDKEEDEGAAFVDVNIVNWANRVVSADSIFVDVEYRIRNAGGTDVGLYEIYFQIDTAGEQFQHEESGDSLLASQVDIATFSKFLRDKAATDVSVSGLWFQ